MEDQADVSDSDVLLIAEAGCTPDACKPLVEETGSADVRTVGSATLQPQRVDVTFLNIENLRNSNIIRNCVKRAKIKI